MKHTFAAILLTCLSLVSLAQEYTLPVDAATHKVSYAYVVEAPGATRNSLYEKGRKWILTKNSPTNPYTVTFENETDGSVTGKGTFMLAGDRKNYVVQFTINVATKDGKYKYDFTDFIVQYKTEGGSHVSGYGMWSRVSHTEAETLEYSLETFYPSRLDSRKPSIKWYEEITKKSFAQIDQTMQAIVGSFKQSMAPTGNW